MFRVHRHRLRRCARAPGRALQFAPTRSRRKQNAGQSKQPAGRRPMRGRCMRASRVSPAGGDATQGRCARTESGWAEKAAKKKRQYFSKIRHAKTGMRAFAGAYSSMLTLMILSPMRRSSMISSPEVIFPKQVCLRSR